MDSLYGPMIEGVKSVLGFELELWDTGGGCTALAVDLEGGVAIYVTDAPNSPYGEEAQISDADHHRQHLGLVGFAIGVYTDEHSTQVAYDEYPHATIEELPSLIAHELGRAVRSA